MDKKDVAAALEEIAQWMELAGENAFKTRSYVNGARRIEQLDEDITTLVHEKRLRDIPGIGEALEQKIVELVSTGKLGFLEELRSQFPPTIAELFSIPGLGPKRIKLLYDTLGVDSLDTLEQACQDGRLATVKGLSDKMAAKILEGIAFSREHSGHHLVSSGHNAALALLAHLDGHPALGRIEIGGSLRRRKEVIKDVDLVASSTDPAALMKHFVAYPEVKTVTGHGDTKSSIVLSSGIACDLRVVPEEAFPYTVLHFTGSKDHNVVLRQRAKERDLKLNEYGLFRGDDTLVECADETAIYAALDLPFLPPEIREDAGEFELTATPVLVSQEDLRGIFHCHTTYSDGVNSVEEMARATQERGYQYLLLCDHSQSAAYANGLSPERLAQQAEEIDAVNARLNDFRILKGIESDIRNDGSLDYEDDVLRRLDLVVASVHSKLEMNEAEATKRVLKAIEHPCTDILGHPTGRLLLRREGFPLNWDRIFDACVANTVAIEINANPHRLDIDWRLIRRGQEKGVLFSIGPDAHRIEGLDCVYFGLGIARKGWLKPEDLLNTRSVEELMRWRKPR